MKLNFHQIQNEKRTNTFDLAKKKKHVPTRGREKAWGMFDLPLRSLLCSIKDFGKIGGCQKEKKRGTRKQID